MPLLVACAARSVNLNHINFDAELAGTSKRVMVMFYAPWSQPYLAPGPLSTCSRCNHCKQTAPIWRSLSEAHQPENVLVAKVDGTANQELLERFRVEEYPTVSPFLALWVTVLHVDPALRRRQNVPIQRQKGSGRPRHVCKRSARRIGVDTHSWT